MTSIASVFYWLLFLSLGASAFGLTVWLFRTVFDKRISPRLKYILWLPVVAAFLLPVRFESPHTSSGSAYVYKLTSAAADEPAIYTSEPAVTTTAKTVQTSEFVFTRSTSGEAETSGAPVTPAAHGSGINLTNIPPVLWLFGAALALLAFFGGFLRLRRLTKSGCAYADPVFGSCARTLGLEGKVKAVISSGISSPVMLGRTVILPPWFNELDGHTRECVLLHELTHRRRRDGALNALLLLLRAVHWFNPVVWLLFREIRADMEVAVDADVVSRMNETQKKRYSLSLVEVLARMRSDKTPQQFLYMSEGKKQTERRIVMIKRSGFFSRKHIIIPIMAVIVAAAAAALCLSIPKKTAAPVSGLSDSTEMSTGTNASSEPDTEPSEENTSLDFMTADELKQLMLLGRMPALSDFEVYYRYTSVTDSAYVYVYPVDGLFFLKISCYTGADRTYIALVNRYTGKLMQLDEDVWLEFKTSDDSAPGSSYAAYIESSYAELAADADASRVAELFTRLMRASLSEDAADHISAGRVDYDALVDALLSGMAPETISYSSTKIAGDSACVYMKASLGSDLSFCGDIMYHAACDIRDTLYARYGGEDSRYISAMRLIYNYWRVRTSGSNDYDSVELPEYSDADKASALALAQKYWDEVVYRYTTEDPGHVYFTVYGFRCETQSTLRATWLPEDVLSAENIIDVSVNFESYVPEVEYYGWQSIHCDYLWHMIYIRQDADHPWVLVSDGW